MRLLQFLLLAMMTAFSTYWMNDSLLSGQYFWAGLFAFFVYRNLRFSYRVTKFIQLMDKATKK